MKIFFVFIIILNISYSNQKFDKYFVDAGKDFNIPPLLLKKIAQIESNLNPHIIGNNKNGTFDYGLMQINTIHLKKLHKKYGITQEQLMNPQVNIYVGAKLLASLISQHGFSFETIGRYHSNTPKYKHKWNKKLIYELQKTLNQNGDRTI